MLNASGTAVDQQGSGTYYQFWAAGQGGQYTNFVKVDGIQPDLRAAPDRQWGAGRAESPAAG